MRPGPLLVRIWWVFPNRIFWSGKQVQASFNLDKFGQLKPLSKFASDEEIMLADSATLKLDNQKNGWKVVCVHQHANGRKFVCIVRAIGCRYCYIRQASDGDCKIWLSEYWDNIKNCCDIPDEKIR